MIFYFIAAWRTFNHIYLFSTAYLIALSLFHLGLFYQRAAGAIKFPTSWEQGSFSPWMESSGWHIILALSAFGIGFSVAVSTGKKYLKDIDQSLIDRAKKAGRWSAIGLMVASGIFFLMAIYSYGNLLNYARHEIFSSSADSRGFGVFMMIFPGSVLLYFFSATTNKQFVMGLCLVTLAFLLFMLSGYRSAALFPTLVGVAIWVKSGKKLPLSVAISGTAIVLILITTSGYLRGLGTYSEMEVEDVSEALEQASIEKSISKMGASVHALANVLLLVPKIDGYRYGTSYIYAITDSIPNVGLKMNAEFSRERALRTKHYNHDVITSLRPADWLTYRVEPELFRKGWGVGFSAVAEPFLNGGTLGVFLFFVLLGYGLGRLDSIPIYQSPYILIFSTSMLWPLIRTVRNDSSNFFKPMIFILIILSVWWVFSRVSFKKKI